MDVTAKGPPRRVARRFDHEIDKVQGSRFLTTLLPADDAEVALAAQAELRADHPHAVHVCFAFVGSGEADTRFSDDGEPSKTAGFPMLRVLMGASLRHSAALVTRYFGGTKLGTGGLVRAYTQAVRQAVEFAPLSLIEAVSRERMACSYAYEPRLRHLLSKHGAALLTAEYDADRVVVCVEFQDEKWPALLSAFGAAIGVELFVLDD